MSRRRQLRWPGLIVLLVVVGLAVALVRAWRSPEARWRAIQEAIDGRRWSEAEPELTRWVAGHPDDGPAWLSLGRVRGQLHREEEAREALSRVPAGDPSWSQAQLLLGDLALARSQAVAAEAHYRGALEGEAVTSRLRLVRLLFLESRLEEARALLWDLHGLTRDPRHLITLTGLALELDQPEQVRDLSGERDLLRGDLDRFLEQDPDDPWLRRARGLMRLDEGRPENARADLEAAAQALDDDSAGRLALAECRLALGDFEAVADHPGPAPSGAGYLGRWWLQRGRAEEARGQVEAAVACYREATVADPRNRSAHYHLGQALTRLGRVEEAGPCLSRAESLRRPIDALKRAVHDALGGLRSASQCEELGQICLEAGMMVEARSWFEQVIRRDPTREAAQTALARLGNQPTPVVQLPRRRAEPALPVPSAPTTVGPSLSGPTFEDVRDRAGLGFSYDCGASGNLFIGDTMGGGVGWIDYDGDGWLDLYFVNGCRLPIDPDRPPAPNRLYRNQGDGSFADVTASAGVGGRGYGMGCAVGDYDNDGHDDLYVTGLGSTRLYHNRGDGTFEDVTTRSGTHSDRWCTAAGFGDLDGDGDLDLVVITYVAADPTQVPDCRDALGKPIHCPPGKFPAQVDHLFRNNGDGTFTDVATAAGLDVPDGRGLGLAIADLDGDGRLDLFVANDAVPNFLFRNRGDLKFEEVGVVAGVAYNGHGLTTASMGVVADDLDGDGRIDLLHTNFRNEGTTYLRNLGGGLFSDDSVGVGLDGPSRPVTGFGVAVFDADQDGYLDLFVANGHVDDQPWIRQPMAQPPQLYRGAAGGRFRLESAAAVGPYFTRTVVGRGVAAGDLDNDGRVDLVVVHRDAPVALLHNTSPGGHWLTVRLVGAASGRTPIGARVSCRVGGRTLVRWQTSGTSYLSSHDPRLAFGLGSAATIDDLEVRWPSGTIQRWSDLAADRILELREGSEPVVAPPRR